MADDLDLARRVRAATAPSSEIGQLARRILEQHGRERFAAFCATCYFCTRAAVTIEAGYAVCEPMFHESMRRRIEDVPPAEPARTTTPADFYPEEDYSVPGWTADETHRHTIGGETWEHAHEGGHEAHSAVCHDLSDADMMAGPPLRGDCSPDAVALDQLAAMLRAGLDLDGSDANESVAEIVEATGRDVWPDAQDRDFLDRTDRARDLIRGKGAPPAPGEISRLARLLDRDAERFPHMPRVAAELSTTADELRAAGRRLGEEPASMGGTL